MVDFMCQHDWILDDQIVGKTLSLGFSVREGEGGMIWENGTETCIISYMK